MDGRMVALSKSLSWLLRHGAAEANVAMDSEGYVLWDEIRALKQFKGYALEDILHVVENNSKKRFQMRGHGRFRPIGLAAGALALAGLSRRVFRPASHSRVSPAVCPRPLNLSRAHKSGAHMHKQGRSCGCAHPRATVNVWPSG